MITILPCFSVLSLSLICSKDFYVLSSYLRMDKFSLLLILVFPFFILFLCKLSPNSLVRSSFSSLLFILFFLLLFFCSQNHFFFILFLECCSLFIIFRVIDLSKTWDKVSSSIFMFLINMVGSIPFIIFCVARSSITPNFLNLGITDFNSSLTLVFCCIFILLSKVPIFLLHFWLTKAHVRAYSVCSMLLASLMIKLGTMGLFKFSFFNFFIYSFFSSFFLSFCLISCLILNFLMLRFFDTKILVACSSILHISLLVPLSFHMNSPSLSSTFFMNCGHGLVSCFLFFLVSLCYEMVHNRSLSSNKSLIRIRYSLCLVLMVTVFFNLGLPPFIGFYRELFICFFFSSFRFIGLALFGVCIFISIIFRIFMVLLISFGKKNSISSFNVDALFFWFFLFLFFLITLSPFFFGCS